MRIALILAGLAVGGCTAQSARLYPAASPAPVIEAWADFLNAHNRERAAVRVQPLVWDVALARAAGDYARQLASSGTLRHSPRQVRAGQGENLWMGTRGAYASSQMIAGWSSEKRVFRPGLFPAITTTGNWADAGHYSQMIWPTTTRLGCAIASNPSADFLVCRYAPGGNIDGRLVP